MAKTQKKKVVRSSSKKPSIEALISFNEFFSMALEAGCSIPMALEQCSKYCDPSLRKNIETCLKDLQIGESIEESFSAMAERSGSLHFKLAVSSVLLAKETGATPVPYLRSMSDRLSRA